MWVESLILDNVRCFEQTTLRFATANKPHKWITFLSENGGGKSTALQALALLLAGPEGAQKLCPRPAGWLRNEDQVGKISVRIHQGDHDPGQFGDKKVSRAFGYTFYLTGSKKQTIRNKVYTEPTIQESVEKRLTWLRQNALTSKGIGWFAVGYGAFRRLTRSSQILVPSLEPQARFSNFSTQFYEDEPLSAFERWMVYLDYRIAKNKDKDAERQKDLGVGAINELLPDGVTFDSVTPEGRILFGIGDQKVPTIALSDGYRSVLALAGDIVWRLIQAFPNSSNPLVEEGVVLIDELDIHLHPLWQRDIALWLQQQFPELQFIVASHSPLVAAGAGSDALTLRFTLKEGKSCVDRVDNIATKDVNTILQSPAFGLVSPFSPQTQSKIDRYDDLSRRGGRRSPAENQEYEQLELFMEEVQPFGGIHAPDSLEARLDSYLKKALP